MKKNILILIICLNFNIIFGQENTPVSKGVVTITTGQKINFIHLKFDGNMVSFTNIDTKAMAYYMIATIKSIVDEQGNFVPFYMGKTLIKTQKEETKLATKVLETPKDTLFKPDYPAGIYKTKEDFVNKKPSDVQPIVAKGLVGFTKPLLNSIEHNCFFYTDSSDEKIKNAFAVSFQGHLYFQINGILSNRNKTDRAQTNDFPNSFVRVIMGGDNYFYTEVALANQWAQGVAMNFGIAGSVLASEMIYGKGVVWDFKNQEFNIFKNCEDYNDFIKDKNSDAIQTCENQQPDVSLIRKAIWKIK
jgi:hypothetical protein